ncbi:LysR family transcriptional regulator [Albidovulum sediminicola]|uniref:LysR family transcriptional regulator n=1 Tax=Albidovulum sediminicola TaxID=2984331 RepID=A0ABT2Z5X8_9RHOB|nr:LysR family transcriptional regulator [Defluviimonas sp. WL0075]MCV2866176.1 LysR family transcriptional regulator [Defluviimonas sp. WL0075]
MGNDGAAELVLLRSFLAVAQTRNISLAAQALGLSQPTVTQHIQRLESLLGVPLLLRSSRPLGLTQPAETLARELPDRIAALDSLLDRVSASRQAPPDVLRIVMPDSLSCIMGAEFLIAAGKLARSLELRSGISPWIEESLQARRCDLAIDCPPFNPETRAHRLELFHDPYLVVRPRAMADLPFERLSTEKPQVAFGRNSKFGTTTAAIASELGATEPPRFSFDSTQSLLRFVQAGYGWAVTSAFCLFQSPGALRDLDICPCPSDHRRAFFLLGDQDALADLQPRVAERLISVFHQLLAGRWTAISPEVVSMVISANDRATGGMPPSAAASVREHPTG